VAAFRRDLGELWRDLCSFFGVMESEAVGNRGASGGTCEPIIELVLDVAHVAGASSVTFSVGFVGVKLIAAVSVCVTAAASTIPSNSLRLCFLR
jgi:hypothetical protein